MLMVLLLRRGAALSGPSNRPNDCERALPGHVSGLIQPIRGDNVRYRPSFFFGDAEVLTPERTAVVVPGGCVGSPIDASIAG